MLYQITAYEVLGGIQLQATTGEAGPTGYHWEHRILEFVEAPSWATDEAWDALWLIAQRIQEIAIARGADSRERYRVREGG